MSFLNLGTAIYFKWTPTTIGSLLSTYQPRWHAVSAHGELLRSQASRWSGKILVLQVEEFVNLEGSKDHKTITCTIEGKSQQGKKDMFKFFVIDEDGLNFLTTNF